MLDGTAASADLLRTLTQQHTARCVERLAEVLNGDDPAAAAAAAAELLSRGYGMPVQPFAADGIHIELEAEEPHHHRPNGNGSRAWNAD
jgi:hypothetical protein